jgi:hypothetical protein
MESDSMPNIGTEGRNFLAGRNRAAQRANLRP